MVETKSKKLYCAIGMILAGILLVLVIVMGLLIHCLLNGIPLAIVWPM